MKLSDLKPAPYNPREIRPEAFCGLSASMGGFGDLSGITFNMTTGHLVTGHQRVRALKEACGDLELQGEWIVTPAGESFRVRLVEWDSEREMIANLAANNPGIMGVFTADVGALVAEAQRADPQLADALRLDEIKLPEGFGEETGEGNEGEDEGGYAVFVRFSADEYPRWARLAKGREDKDALVELIEMAEIARGW